jgi:hypothetical protein
MRVRRAAGVLAMLLLGHLLVAQNLYACAPSHGSGTHEVAGSQHCQQKGPMAQPVGHHPQTPTQRDGPPQNCCTALTSCGITVMASSPSGPTDLSGRSALLPASAGDALRGRVTGPIPPPPRPLSL